MIGAALGRPVVLWLTYAAVSALMVAPLVNFSQLASASYEGDARLIIWTLAWNNHAVIDRLSLFDSNIYYPATGSLRYNEHLFGLSVFTLPITALGGNPVLAYNVIWLLSFVLNGIAAHVWLRRYTAADAAAFAGSLVYTFSYYKMLHAHGHLHLVWTWLLPLSLLALHRWSDRPTLARALAWSGTLVLQVLTSWYIAVFAALANFALLACLLVVRRTDLLRRAVHLGLAGLIVGVCTWPFALEYRYLPKASTAEVGSNSADLAGYLVPPENTWMGRLWQARGGGGPRWIWGERTLYIGWIALSFAAAGLVAGLRASRRVTLLYLGVVLAAFLLSLGPSVTGEDALWRPFNWLSAVPGLGGFRAPARFAQLVLLGLAVLVALGVGWALQAFPSRGPLVVTILVALMLSEWYVVGFPGGKPRPFGIPAIYRAPEVRAARALVSLPEYRGTPEWYTGADYLLFSTAHWRPIVNGFGRTEPADHASVVSHMRAFPGPNNARTMRRLGVEYIVLHADRYGAGAKELVEVARQMSEYTLVSRVGNDYLFKVNP